MTDRAQQIAELIRQSGLRSRELKDLLRQVVRENWPDLPPWSTLDGPLIEEVQKANVGSGVVLTFEENGIRKVVLGQAGEHYKNPKDPNLFPVSYTIPGGFINLTRTPGSSKVPASETPEDPRTGAVREVEEEFRKPDGSPLLEIDPARLKPMDTKTLAFPNGEKRIVLGLMLELTADEIAIVKVHVSRLGSDSAYKDAVAMQTINEASGRPEIAGAEIFLLDDVAGGKCNLLHKDQQSLFLAVRNHFQPVGEPKAKTGPEYPQP